MRDYEIVYVFDSTLEEEEVESKLDAYHERITGEGSGEITAVEDWGKRQLAYPIENQEKGHYVVAQFSVEPEALEEFERRLNLDGDLLRHLVVLHEGELPTPPSARRPDAGPGDEEEEQEEEEEEEKEGEGEDGEAPEDEEEEDEGAAGEGEGPADEEPEDDEAEEDESEEPEEEESDEDEEERE